MPKRIKHYLLRLHLNLGRHLLRLSYSISENANGQNVKAALKDALSQIDPLPGKGRKSRRDVEKDRRDSEK